MKQKLITLALWAFNGIPLTAAAAALTIALQDDRTVRVQWPAAACGYALEQTEDLGDHASWRASTLLPVLSDTNFVVSIQRTSPSLFLRLRLQSPSDWPLALPSVPGLRREELKLGAVSALATGDFGGSRTRVYVGRYGSNRHDRRNLGVVELDSSGAPIGEPIWHEDCAEPLALDSISTVERIVVSPGRQKLYLATDQWNVKSPQSFQTWWTVWNLDAAGKPAGAPRSFLSPITNTPGRQFLQLALHPTLNLLYVVGYGSGAVHTYDLDAIGDPMTNSLKRYDIASSIYDLAVGCDGRHLYLGFSANTLRVVDLDGTGAPRPDTAKAYDFGPPPVADPDPFLQFIYTPRAIYRRHWPQLSAMHEPAHPLVETVPRWPLVVWPLETNGLPAGPAPRAFPNVCARAEAAAPCIEKSPCHLWLAVDDVFEDAFTGEPRSRGTALVQVDVDDAGLPTGNLRRTSTSYGQEALLLDAPKELRPPAALVQNRRPLFIGNEVGGQFLRFTVLQAKLPSGQEQTSLPAWLYLAGNPRAIKPDLTLGQPSRAISLDADFGGILSLRDSSEPLQLDFGVLEYHGLIVLDQLRVKIEVYDGDPGAGGTLLKSLTEQVSGNVVQFWLPGYGFLPPGEREEQIELYSEHLESNVPAATAVVVPQAERPRQFVVAGGLSDNWQATPSQLLAQATIVSSLGINTVAFGAGSFFDPTNVDSVLDRFGLQWRWGGTSSQPGDLGYFDFSLKRLTNELDLWAGNQTSHALDGNGGRTNDLALFALADEPTWRYPAMLDAIRTNTDYRTDFQDYLEAQHLVPADFGEADWAGVVPIGAGIGAATGADLPTRRRYYWTARFITEAATAGVARERHAVTNLFGSAVQAYVNWNNPVSRWYVPTPDCVGSDAALGRMDWFQAGRQNAHTLWTEDWLPDESAQDWSYYADGLRCAAMLGDQKFGAYVVCNTMGAHTNSAALRLFSLVGHGAKLLVPYSQGRDLIGPNPREPGKNLFGTVAEALLLLGRGESLLYPGQPSRGKVAILLPGASRLWDYNWHPDPNPRAVFYEEEIRALHYALIHAGYTVDFTDDTDLETGALSARGYTTLYVTGPNVSTNAQRAIANWVQAGGVLAVTPGAAVADEYNEPTALLDPVLGLGSRSALRTETYQPRGLTNELAQVNNDAFGTAAARVPLFEPVVDLPVLATPVATIVASLTNGGAGITLNSYGSGQAIAYGFFPGQQYWDSANRDDSEGEPWQFSRFPYGWGARQRRVAVAPAILASTPKAVGLSHELVEACRLDSSDGVAVVLLNWSDEPISNLTVTLSNVVSVPSVTSARGVAVSHSFQNGTVTATLPLDYVDVLLMPR